MYNVHDQNLSDFCCGPIFKLYKICLGVIFGGPKTKTNQNLAPLNFDHTVWGICLIKLNNYFFNACFNWMIPNLYLENCCFIMVSIHLSKTDWLTLGLLRWRYLVDKKVFNLELTPPDSVFLVPVVSHFQLHLKKGTLVV